MKLKITRDQEQKKGLLGGNKGIEFSLQCQVDLTQEEKALIEKAKVGEYILTHYYPFESESTVPLRVNHLVSGMNNSTKNISDLLKLEDEIKNGCQNLKSLLEVIATFGGEEIIEI